MLTCAARIDKCRQEVLPADSHPIKNPDRVRSGLKYLVPRVRRAAFYAAEGEGYEAKRPEAVDSAAGLSYMDV